LSSAAVHSFQFLPVAFLTASSEIPAVVVLFPGVMVTVLPAVPSLRSGGRFVRL